MFEGKKTYIGLVIAALPVVAGLFGYTIAPGAGEELSGLLATLADNAEEVIGTGGLLLAWYGRAVTKGN